MKKTTSVIAIVLLFALLLFALVPAQAADTEAEWFSFLLIGTDTRKDEANAGRSDTMIICSINKKTDTITLCSLMRDMYVPIPGNGSNRINAAYTFGGIALLDQTIEENFGVDIDANVVVDFDGFLSALEVIGNLDIELTQADKVGVHGVYPQIGNDSRLHRQWKVCIEPGEQAHRWHEEVQLVLQHPSIYLLLRLVPRPESCHRVLEIAVLPAHSLPAVAESQLGAQQAHRKLNIVACRHRNAEAVVQTQVVLGVVGHVRGSRLKVPVLHRPQVKGNARLCGKQKPPVFRLRLEGDGHHGKKMPPVQAAQGSLLLQDVLPDGLEMQGSLHVQKEDATIRGN